MHLRLIKRRLLFDKHKIKCVIGKNGLSSNKKEGDFTTPKGKFKFLDLYYRKDRVKNIKTKLKKRIIKKNMGWCDDANSKFYNKLIKTPSNLSHEKLYRNDSLYDILIVINYNIKPTIKKKGSAIFLHLTKKNQKYTKGCIAVSKKNMKLILNYISNRSKVYI